MLYVLLPRTEAEEKADHRLQDGGEDIQRILSQVDEPLIGGLILGSESRKKTVYELMQLNRESECRFSTKSDGR